jgi:hypothetical protein
MIALNPALEGRNPAGRSSSRRSRKLGSGPINRRAEGVFRSGVEEALLMADLFLLSEAQMRRI